MIGTLDTHELVKDLQAAGFTDAQAEAVTRAVKKAQELDFSDLVTKADLSAEIAALRAEIKTGLSDLRAELIKWVVGIAFAQIATIIAILRLFPAAHP